jgi:hypothetical protein
MTQYAVIGLSPFSDVSVAVGPFKSVAAAGEAHDGLVYRGWNAETVELSALDEIPNVSNEEGS